MSNKKEFVVVAGKKISLSAYEYLVSSFKEAFSHTSLSVEKAFEELEKCNITLEKSMDKNAYEYYLLLPHSERNRIRSILHQIIVFKGSIYGVITEKLTGEAKQFEKLYHDNFMYFEKYIYYYIKYDSNGNFDKVTTLHNLETLFINLPLRRLAYDKAYNMKKDNLDAFDYVFR